MLNFHTTWYLGVFGVGDYESVLRFQKFKMANPIWRTALFKINRIGLKLVTRGFSGSLITNLYTDSKNSKWWIQYCGQKQMTTVSVADDVVRVKDIVVICFCGGNSCHLTTQFN